jgi:hypothetical protein
MTVSILIVHLCDRLLMKLLEIGCEHNFVYFWRYEVRLCDYCFKRWFILWLKVVL